MNKQAIERPQRRLPRVSDLSTEDQARVQRLALVDILKDEARSRLLGDQIDLDEEIEIFVSDKTKNTARNYKSQLRHIRAWMDQKGLNVAEVTPALADDFIRALRDKGVQVNTLRLIVSATSSLWSWMSRRYDFLRNPFHGTQVRPKVKWAPIAIPPLRDIDAIMRNASPRLRLAVAIALATGLRVSAIANVRIKPDGHWMAETKGEKTMFSVDPLPGYVMDLWRAYKGGLEHPFAVPSGHNSIASHSLSEGLRNLCRYLQEDGILSGAYTFHKFRHHFAMNNLDKGIMWLKERLGHASVTITEQYLRGKLRVSTRDM